MNDSEKKNDKHFGKIILTLLIFESFVIFMSTGGFGIPKIQQTLSSAQIESFFSRGEIFYFLARAKLMTIL